MEDIKYFESVAVIVSFYSRMWLGRHMTKTRGKLQCIVKVNIENVLLLDSR